MKGIADSAVNTTTSLTLTAPAPPLTELPFEGKPPNNPKTPETRLFTKRDADTTSQSLNLPSRAFVVDPLTPTSALASTSFKTSNSRIAGLRVSTVRPVATAPIPKIALVQSAVAGVASATMAATTTGASAVFADQCTNGALPPASKLVWDFLFSHESFPDHPKYRYAYVLWLFVLAVSLAYAIAHRLKLSGGSFGARYNKWGMRRNKMPMTGFVLPSNSYLVTISVFTVLLILLSTLGPDQLAEAKGVKNYVSSQLKQAHEDVKRALNHFDTFEEFKREANSIQWRQKRATMPNGDNTVEELTTLVTWEVNKSIWTQGNRWGFMVFASFPLLVTLACKSAPFGIFTIKWFTGLHWDKVSTYHRSLGWVVWVMTTVHVGLWAVQVTQFRYEGGPLILAFLGVWRFRWALTAYFSMTIAMFGSLRYFRNLSYEVFYAGHCILMFLAMFGAMVHHYIIAHWVAIALFLWAGDHLYRYWRYRRLNGIKRVTENRVLDVEEAKLESVNIPPGYAQVQLLPSRTVRLSIRTPRPMKWHAGQSVFLHLPEYSKYQTHPFTIANNCNPDEMVILIKAREGLTRKLYDHCHLRLQASLAVKLTEHYHNFRYAKLTGAVDSNTKFTPGSQDVIDEDTMTIETLPIFVRAAVDGPMGSAGNIPWKDYHTVLLVCGGSGITFGTAMSDWITELLSKQESGNIKRLRLVWIVREYAEVSWVSGMFSRFKARLPNSKNFKIDIYVTNAQSRAWSDDDEPSEKQHKGYDMDASAGPPRPKRAGSDDTMRTVGSTLSSSSSIRSTRSRVGYYDGVDRQTGMTHAELKHLSLFDGEKDMDDDGQRRFSMFLGQIPRNRPKNRRAGHYSQRLPKVAHEDVFETEEHRMQDAQRVSQLNHRISATESVERFNPFNDPHDAPSYHAQDHLDDHTDAHLRFREPHPLSTVWDQVDLEQQYPPQSPVDTTVDDELWQLRKRTQLMVPAVDPGATLGPMHSDQLWIDKADREATKVWCRNTHRGRPPLRDIVEKELSVSEGSMIVGNCGPSMLGNALRAIVADVLDPAKLASGDKSGHVTMYTEDFEM